MARFSKAGWECDYLPIAPGPRCTRKRNSRVVWKDSPQQKRGALFTQGRVYGAPESEPQQVI